MSQRSIPDGMSQAQAQEFNYRIAHEWHIDVDMECAGVDLGDALTYDAMRVVGTILKRHIGEGEGDGRTNEQEQPAEQAEAADHGTPGDGGAMATPV